MSSLTRLHELFALETGSDPGFPVVVMCVGIDKNYIL